MDYIYIVLFLSADHSKCFTTHTHATFTLSNALMAAHQKRYIAAA